MEPTANLCAQIPVLLLARIREEQEKAGLPRGEYIMREIGVVDGKVRGGCRGVVLVPERLLGASATLGGLDLVPAVEGIGEIGHGLPGP